MLFEIFVVLWVGVLFVAVYFFAKSLKEAIAKGRAPRIIGESKQRNAYSVPAHHMSPTGHRGRTPAH
ncbi:MAG: hypothetical protein WBW04_04340 [Nitrolancea sp.]